jgi:cell division protein FtsI (penicillin-binding protein 3)
MPDLHGWPAMDAVTVLESLGIEVMLKGKGKVKRQSQLPGKTLGKTKKVTLTLS